MTNEAAGAATLAEGASMCLAGCGMLAAAAVAAAAAGCTLDALLWDWRLWDDFAASGGRGNEDDEVASDDVHGDDRFLPEKVLVVVLVDVLVVLG